MTARSGHLEHAFRFLKQAVGWTRPLLRDPAAAGRWTWLVLAACAQLYLARDVAADARRPRPAPAAPTPSRVSAGFRHAHGTVGTEASVAKPARPGPGRPPGSKNNTKAPRQPVGKTSPKKRKPAARPRKKNEISG